ncbi:hypothetical protein [Magnetospirillum sp. 15-1]|uniref:hypothetical protein n=1 Tax=Magnetospirillum sp. 15-1 TaxID=1979370 RepID=UPI001143A340|nr:hypothetical protein [Magnetospirillum sp. 15-1]
MSLKVEEFAKRRAMREGIPESLLVPVVAVDQNAITEYVGEITPIMPRSPEKALLVTVRAPDTTDRNLRVWNNPASNIYFQERQVWVHVDYHGYRRAYKKAMPSDNIDKFVLSHTMGRPMARILGFNYIRLTPVTKKANTSSILSEIQGCRRYADPKFYKKLLEAKPRILYADTTEMLLMLDIMIGGNFAEEAYWAEYLFAPVGTPPPPDLIGSLRTYDWVCDGDLPSGGDFIQL